MNKFKIPFWLVVKFVLSFKCWMSNLKFKYWTDSNLRVNLWKILWTEQPYLTWHFWCWFIQPNVLELRWSKMPWKNSQMILFADGLMISCLNLQTATRICLQWIIMLIIWCNNYTMVIWERKWSNGKMFVAG